MTDTVVATRLPPPLPPLRQPEMRMKPPFFDFFNSRAKKLDLPSIIKNLTSRAYHGLEDKGSQMLTDHINDVRDAAAAMYLGKLPRNEFDNLRLLTEAHEVGEIKDANGNIVWTRAKLLAFRHEKQALPIEYVDDILTLAKKPGQPYLNYIWDIAKNMRTLRAKRADLHVNQSPNREKLNPEETKDTFKDKKAFLYPCADAYLAACEEGIIDPNVTMPRTYIIGQPQLVAMIPDGDAARLAKYWDSNYTPPADAPTWTGRAIGAWDDVTTRVRNFSF